MVNSVAVNRPLVIRRGWEGHVESNQTNAYLNDWAVFRLPIDEDGSYAELRMPVMEAKGDGLIIDIDSIVYTPEDYEEFKDEDGNDD